MSVLLLLAPAAAAGVILGTRVLSANRRMLQEARGLLVKSNTGHGAAALSSRYCAAANATRSLPKV